MPRPIIGISGYKGTGKDLLTELFQTKFFNSKAYALADPLKKYVSDKYSIPLIHFYSSDKDTMVVKSEEGWDLTIRELLQHESDKLKAEVGKDIWIDKLELQVRFDLSIDPTLDAILISDVRVEEEIAKLKSVGGKLIWINAPNLHPELSQHPTDLKIEDFADYIIFNSYDGNILERDRCRIEFLRNLELLLIKMKEKGEV